MNLGPPATLTRLKQTSAARLRSVPLQFKLLAAVLALVVGALMLISVASTLALRGYLLTRIDDELGQVADQVARGELDKPNFPTDYLVARLTLSGYGKIDYKSASPDNNDLPRLPESRATIEARLGDQPYTVTSINKSVHWRMRVMPAVVADLNGNEQAGVIYVGRSMEEIDYAVSRLLQIDLLVGLAVTLALAMVGATIVRRSLVPLVQIERTAGAIAAGDLTRRVPDPEPDVEQPRTELGRLSRALNAMLAQIEAAFTARARSETAARAAESAARDAAAAAQSSEARAVRSEQKMRQFVADASHELRTPLTTIRGFAELYRQGAVSKPEDVAGVVRRIENEAARMGLLVEDLLLLARLDRERPLTLAPVELPVLAMDAVQAAQATAPDRKIELDVRDEPERLIAYGDDARLRQVIGNLMTNALVHTPPDATVTLRLFAAAGGRAAFEVADTGPGLSEKQREHVFERFYRADEARTRHTERAATGTGLGLAIVAAIVRAHHGTVEVVSEPGEGATFRVTLPALEPAD